MVKPSRPRTSTRSIAIRIALSARPTTRPDRPGFAAPRTADVVPTTAPEDAAATAYPGPRSRRPTSHPRRRPAEPGASARREQDASRRPPVASREHGGGPPWFTCPPGRHDAHPRGLPEFRRTSGVARQRQDWRRPASSRRNGRNRLGSRSPRSARSHSAGSEPRGRRRQSSARGVAAGPATQRRASRPRQAGTALRTTGWQVADHLRPPGLGQPAR
jgi:hypothetical protein